MDGLSTRTKIHGKDEGFMTLVESRDVRRELEYLFLVERSGLVK